MINFFKRFRIFLILFIFIIGFSSMVHDAAGGVLTCNMQMSQGRYDVGDKVTASVLRLANSGTAPLPAEIKIWLGMPGNKTMSINNIGADGSISIPAGFDKDFGPVTLFPVTTNTLPGPYELSCRMLDPITGGLMAEDINPFKIGPSLVVRTGPNGILETAVYGDDIALLPANAGMIATDAAATGSGLCVFFGSDFASDTTVGTGDVAGADGLTIRTGTDGDCDSTANSNPAGTADDIQVVAVGDRSGVCVLEGGTDVTQDGDDVDSDGDAGGLGMILTGLNGVCDTDNMPALPANATLIVYYDSSTPNAVGISPGADGVLNTTTLNNIYTPCVGCDDSFD